jgi:hypothetical protein
LPNGRRALDEPERADRNDGRRCPPLPRWKSRSLGGRQQIFEPGPSSPIEAGAIGLSRMPMARNRRLTMVLLRL